jgi:hypothetical protein
VRTPTLDRVQVLIDADNLSTPRIEAFLRALPEDEAEVTVAGSPRALSPVEWPRHARVVAIEGWQRADMVLAEAYRQSGEPLVLVSGDGDFAGLVRGHDGDVLVVSDRPASGLRGAGTVLDPILDGLEALRSWFDAVVDTSLTT